MYVYCTSGRLHTENHGMAGNRYSMAGKTKEEAVMAKGVLLKGLPFQTTRDDIKVFFKSLVIPYENIRLIKFIDGESTGLAFVKLEDEEEIKRALLMDRNHMGSRYIEVRVSDESELYHLILRARAGTSRNELYKISGHGGSHDYPIYKRLATKFAYISGVPRGSQYKEIRNFFAGRLIGRGKIWLLREEGSGHFRGDGYVEFASSEECLLALQNSGKMIGSSVVDVEPCEMEEAEEFSEGNLGQGGRDIDYRQNRMVYEGSWDGGRGARDREDIQGGRHVSAMRQSRRRTPSPARRRRERYTATYGNNTILREDLYVEPGLDGELPYDHNGSFSSAPYPSSAHAQSAHFGGGVGGGGGGDIGHIHGESLGGGYRRTSGGPSIDNFLGVAYGGHATVARQQEKPYSSMFSGVPTPSGSSRPLMSLMGSGGGGGSGGGAPERRVVRVEGLPYHVTVPHLLEFFHGYELSYDHVRIQCRDDGSPSGKAFVTFPSERVARMATQQLNKRYIGDRYVELFLV